MAISSIPRDSNGLPDFVQMMNEALSDRLYGRWMVSLKSYQCDDCQQPLHAGTRFLYLSGTGRSLCSRCAVENGVVAA